MRTTEKTQTQSRSQREAKWKTVVMYRKLLSVCVWEVNAEDRTQVSPEVKLFIICRLLHLIPGVFYLVLHKKQHHNLGQCIVHKNVFFKKRISYPNCELLANICTSEKSVMQLKWS